jgi:hypothetical protein
MSQEIQNGALYRSVMPSVETLADVVRSKEAAGREKDRLALPRLRRLLDRLQRDD